MARWTIYDKNGNVKAITNGITVGSRTMPELEYSGTWMGETFVTISVKSEQPVNWQIGDYLIYRGEKFVLNYDPSVVKKARRNTYGEGFVYDGVKFNSLNVEMSDVQFLDEVLSDNHIHYTSLPVFSFFAATIDDYADRLQANMNRYCLQNNFVLSEWWLILTPSRTRTVARGAGISGLSTRLGAAWDIAYQDEPSTDGEKFNQNVSISKSTVFAGLANIYNLFGLHYVTSGRTLIIGAAGKIASHVFEYGKGNGLYEIERVADSEQQLVTKLYAYGNSTNLPIRYYSNIAKVCVGKVTGIQRTGNTQLSLDTDLPYQDSYFSNRTGDIIPRALVTIRSHVITIGGGVIKRDNNTVMVSIFLKTSPDDPDWYTTDSQGLATLIQQMQVGDELIFVEGADIDKWPAGHFSYGSAIPNNLAINNLMLPGFPTQSLKAWVLANGGTLNQDDTVTWNGHTAFFSTNELAPYILSPNSAALGVREASKTWDGSDDTEDIYPTIENTGDDILVSADIITDNGVFGDGDEVPNFSVVVKGLGADVELDSLISNSGDAAKISMKDGYCGGREFSVVIAEKVSGSTNWKLTLKRDYDEALQLYFPYSNNASIGQTPVANEAYQLRGADIAGYDGDKFVWLGIDMPSEYIEASAEKLLDAALTFLEANDYARYTYSPKVDEIYMAKQHDAAVASQSSQNPFDSLHDTLHEGNLMQFDDEDLMIDGNIFIDKLTIKEYGNGTIPTYDVTLRNHKSVGTYQRLLNTVDSLSGKGGASGIWGNGGVSTSQTKDLIKQEGDKRYIRRDINDETNTDLTANKFIAKEGVKTDVIESRTTNAPVTVDDDLVVSGDLDVTGDTELNGDVTIGESASDTAFINAIAKIYQQIKSNNYNGDSPFDQGWMIKNADANHGNASYMVIDNLFVRMKAIFTELEIRKISYAGGNIVLSHAGSTLVKVVSLTSTMQPTIVNGKLTISGNLARVENDRVILDNGTISGNRIILDGSQEILYAYRCYIKKDDGTTATENWWREDDQARCQTFNIDETGTYHDVSNSFYWRRVMNVGSEVPIGETTDEVMDYVDLSALDCITGSTVPQAGDVIVQMGNRTDVSRQGFISLEVYGDDAPAFKVYKYVNSYTLNGKMPIIISPRNTSMKVQHYEIETDYGTFPAVKERGDWSLIPEHKCHYYDRVQHNGSSWLCVYPSGLTPEYTTDEPSLSSVYWKVDAKAGEPAPSYTEDWFTWSNVASVVDVTTEPTPNSGWLQTIGAQGSYTYLWRKLIRYIWNPTTRVYVADSTQYFRMSGTNGTSIDINGEVALHTDMEANGYVTPVGGTRLLANDGESYVLQEDWTDSEGVNRQGHLFMWSTESTRWIPLGKFQGENGKTYYTHVAWATSVTYNQSTGEVTNVSGFVITKAPDDTTHFWMGVYVDENSAIDPSDALLYTWSYTKGEAGTSVFVDEENSSTEYAISTSGTQRPVSGWQSNPPSVPQGQFLWTRVTTVFTDGGQTVSYGVSYRGVDGDDVQIDTSRTFVRYSTVKTSSQPADSTFTRTTPPELSEGDYLWSLSQTAYVNVVDVLKSYSVSRLGVDGDTGQRGPDGYTTHFAYATSPDGSRDFSTTNFKGAKYIGTYRDDQPDDSTTYTDYTWTLWGALELPQLILSPSLISIPTDTDGVVLQDFRQEIEVSMKTYSDVLLLKSVDFTANENVVVEASTLIAMSWSGASVQNGRLVNVEGSVNNGRLTISADDYTVVPTKIVVKATKGTTLTERTVSITATALDEDGNEYNGYNELTVQRQYIAEDGADGDDGEDAINVVLSPFAVLFSQDVSSDDDTAAHAIAQITPETIASQVVVTKGETPITTGVVVSVSSTSHFNTSGVTIEGTTITLDKDGIQVYEESGKYYPYDNGSVDLNVAYNGENYSLRLQFYVNLMGKFKTNIEGDVETSIANKTWYEYNPATGQYDKETTMGEFVRSSSKNTSVLTETENDTISAMSEVLQKVDNISLTVYENKEGIDLFTHTDDVVVGTSWTTISTISNTTECKTMCVSIPMEIEKKSADSTINFRIYTKNTSGGATIDTIIQYCTFNNGVLTSTVNKSRFDAITSYVRDSKEYVKGVLYFEKTQSSTFKMVDVDARNTGTAVSCTLFKSRKFSVGVSLKDGLVGTGIDIVNGKITMTADKFECQNNSGVKTAWLDDMGNFTVRGVYNNLITEINSATSDKYIVWEDESSWNIHGCIDVLRCGNVIRITKLPVMDAWDGGSTNKLLRLPWFLSYDNYDRTMTNNPYTENIGTHLIKGDEMKQLVGRKIDIIFDIPSSDNIGVCYLEGAFNIKPAALDSDISSTVRSLANGQTTVNYEADILNNRASIRIVKKMTVHLECKLVWVIFGAGADANRRNYFAYIWTAYSSYGESDRREDIDEEWT